MRSKALSGHGAGAIEVDFPLKPFPFLFMSSDMTAELLLGATEADRDVASLRCSQQLCSTQIHNYTCKCNSEKKLWVVKVSMCQ